MATKLYVGNLPWSVTNGDLEHTIETLGLACSKAEVVYDRETDQSRGFGFLHFDTDEAARLAMAALNGYEMKGRELVVNEATSRQRESGGRTPRSGGEDRRGGGGGRGGGGRGRKPRGFRDDGDGCF